MNFIKTSIISIIAIALPQTITAMLPSPSAAGAEVQLANVINRSTETVYFIAPRSPGKDISPGESYSSYMIMHPETEKIIFSIPVTGMYQRNLWQLKIVRNKITLWKNDNPTGIELPLSYLQTPQGFKPNPINVEIQSPDKVSLVFQKGFVSAQPAKAPALAQPARAPAAAQPAPAPSQPAPAVAAAAPSGPRVQPEAAASMSASIVDAAMQGNVEILQSIITQNPTIIRQYHGEVSPLIYAFSRRGRNVPIERTFEVVKLLLRAGANPNAVNPFDHKTVLHYAVETGYPPLVRYLLTHGAQDSVNVFGGINQKTPLADLISYTKGAIYATASLMKAKTEQEFKRELPQALQAMKYIEEKELSVQQVIDIINLLKAADAHDLPNKGGIFAGKNLAYIINHGLLVFEPDRDRLLQTIGAHYSPRNLSDINLTHLGSAIDEIKTLIQQGTPNLEPVLWTLEVLRTEMNEKEAYLLIKIALAFFENAIKDYKAALPANLSNLLRTLMGVAFDIKREVARSEGLQQEAAPAALRISTHEIPQMPPAPQRIEAPAAAPSAAPSLAKQVNTRVTIGNVSNGSAQDVHIESRVHHAIAPLADVPGHSIFPIHEEVNFDEALVSIQIKNQPAWLLRVDKAKDELVVSPESQASIAPGIPLGSEPLRVNIAISAQNQITLQRA